MGNGNELVRTSPATAQPPAPELDILTLGRVLSQSGYFTDARDEAKAVTKILLGRELGVGPVSALMNIDIVENKPSLKPALMAALIQRSGRFAYRVRESTDQACRIEFFEGAQPLGIASFTLEEAAKADLTRKTNWQRYPSDMLFARAMSRGARRFCPGIFLGVVYAPEEVENLETVEVDPNTGEVLPPEPETEQEALKRTTGFLFAQADDAGIDTKDIEGMRRLCAHVLSKDVTQIRNLDPADRATVGYWIKANPADAYLLVNPKVEAEAKPSTESPLTLSAVARAEVAETYAQAKGF